MQKITVNVLMADGTEHRAIPTILADQVAYSQTRQRHKWPTMEDDPLLFGAFLAYSAMKRLGLFEGSWDMFTESVAAVDADDIDEVDPT